MEPVASGQLESPDCLGPELPPLGEHLDTSFFCSGQVLAGV